MADELLKNVPPHNLEAERAVLGALLLDEKAIDFVVQEIKPEDFYRPVHATLYETMVELNKRGEPIDAVALVSELRQKGTLESVGGPTEIATLSSVVPTSANAVYYAKLVKDKALLRRALTTLAGAQRDIFESREKTDELLDRIEKQLFEVTQKRVKSEATDIATVLKQTFQLLQARKAGTDDAIKYGYPSLDDMTHGLHKGDLVIIAARPSMGKCVTAGTEVVLEDGSVTTIAEIVRRREARLLTLGDDYRLRFTSPSQFVDDGEKPAFRVTTRLGRVVETTATHPFLTAFGWRALEDIAVGTSVAVPRAIPVFGSAAVDRPSLEKLVERARDEVPAEVFTLPRPQLAFFLEQVLVQDRHATERVARQIQHLLLRFGIVARVARDEDFLVLVEEMATEDTEHTEGPSVRRSVSSVSSVALSRAPDPSSVIEATEIDVLWDPIVSIEPLGPRRVFDLTIPDTHNFVANDVCVHNTTFAINILRNVAVGKPGASASHGAVFFSLEMPRVQIVSNLLCSMAKVDSHRLRGGFLSREEEQNLLDWGELLEKQPIFIDDTPGLTVMELRGKARRLKAEGKIEAILIDYLQLMRGDLGSSDKARHEVVAEISRSLKALARELEIPVIALAQLNRNVEDRPDHRPRMADLRECVTGDTLVVLADGRRVPIRDLVGTTPEVIAMAPSGKLMTAASDRVWSVGVRDVFRVKLASGRSIRCTGRHRLYGAGGWKRVSALKPDDRIAIARALPEPGVTEDWNDDRLILLGHLVGDGSYLSGKPLRYTTSSEDNSNAVATAARREFGLTVNRHEGRGRWHQLVLSGNGNRWHPAGANLWLRQLGIFGQRSHQKRLPAGVFQLPNTRVAFLLKHLWATDGCIHVSKKGAAPRVFFATNSAGLAGDVAALLLRLGIVARIREVRQGQYRPLYSVDVSGATDQRRFVEVVGGFGPRREPAERLELALVGVNANTNVDTLPREAFDRVRALMAERGISTRRMTELRGTAYGGSSHFRFAPSRAIVTEYATILEDPVLLEAAQSDVFWDRIVEIVPEGREEVFDLTVPGPASWLADGIVSHNSGSIEQDADVVMLLHRDEYYLTKEKAEAEQKVNKAQVLVQKNRNGPIGDVELYYAKEYSYFGELTR